MNRIHAIQQFLAKDGILKESYCPGILGTETLDALCAWYMQKRNARRTANERVPSVDFPQFVEDLIKGVFDANVQVSVKQMEAYIEILRNAINNISPFDKLDP